MATTTSPPPSAGEAHLASRLTDLESDSFQLKLRNYYLERRLNATLADRAENEHRVGELLEEEAHSAVIPVRVQAAPPPPLPQATPKRTHDYAAAEELSRLHTLRREEETRYQEELIRRRYQEEEAHLRGELERARQKVREHEEAETALKRDLDEARKTADEMKRRAERSSAKSEELSKQLEDAQKELIESKASMEDIVAFEAEQIADLARERDELARRIEDMRALNQISDDIVEEGTARALSPNKANLLTERARDLKKHIDQSFDFLEHVSPVARSTSQPRSSLASPVEHSSSSSPVKEHTSPPPAANNFANYLDLGARLAAESRRPRSGEPTDHAKLRALLRQSRSIVSSQLHRSSLDPRLDDCLTFALRLAEQTNAANSPPSPSSGTGAPRHNHHHHQPQGRPSVLPPRDEDARTDELI